MRITQTVPTLKRIDFYVQIVCYVAALFYGLLLFNALDFFDMLPFYFVLGGYQLTSALVTVLLPLKRSRLRKIYYALVALLFLSAAIAILIKDYFYVGGFFLLFASPLVAVFYTYICYQELSIVSDINGITRIATTEGLQNQGVSNSEPPAV
jgi:hypothetical protein